MMRERFTFDGRVRSFGHAFRGVGLMLRTQHNAWIHAAVSGAVITVAALFDVTAAEWVFLILAMMAVWTAEALNTALELLADVASPDFHPLVGRAKDVAAAAVLLSATGAAAIGAVVLGPYCVPLVR